jgi:tetratricopeptide (TPR) repeat protein
MNSFSNNLIPEETNEYEEIILNSNKTALQLLKIEDYQSAKTYLDTSINILTSRRLPNSNKLMGVTLNNYGCLYKRQGHLSKALKYFHKSIEASIIAGSNVAETYLNISNILSQTSKHEEALQAAFKALKSLDSIKKSPQIATLAYQAMGKEFKYLGMTKESLRMFQKAKNLNPTILGSASQLTNSRYSSHMPGIASLSRETSSFKLSKSPHQFFRNTDRKSRIATRTPDIESTDRIFMDFIPAPVNFDRIMKKYPNRSTDRLSKQLLSITPKPKKKESSGKINFKRLNPSCKMCKSRSSPKRRADILTPVPRRYKLSLPSRAYSPLL